MSAADDTVEVVKWYTRARRFPTLIGKTPDGMRLWGGPYTYTQVAVGVTLLIVGVRTVNVWGRFGLIGNVLLLAGGTYAAVAAAGRLPIGSRNPLTLVSGLVRALTGPATGRRAGRPLRPRRPYRARGRVIVGCSPVATPTPTSTPSRPEPPVRRADPPSPARPPALTGVQRLLAGERP